MFCTVVNTYFEENDVLFAKITPSMQNGKSAIARYLINRFGFGSTEFHVLRPKAPVLPEWIHLYIRRMRFRDEAKKEFKGAVGQQRVPAEFLESYLIPVPYPDDPVLSQHIQRIIVARIESLLDELREIQDLHDAIDRDLAQVMDSVLAEIFSTQPNKDWPIIGELGEIRGGIQKTPKRIPRGNPRPYLRVANVQWRRLDLDDIAYFEVSDEELKRYRLFPNDLLIIEGNGSPELIGRSAVFRGEIEDCVHQNHVIRFRPDPSKINSDFLSEYLSSPLGRHIIEQLSHTSSGLLNLSIGKIKSIPVPIIPPTQQEQVVVHLNSIRVEILEMQSIQSEDHTLLEQVEQSILEQAFRGEL